MLLVNTRPYPWLILEENGRQNDDDDFFQTHFWIAYIIQPFWPRNVLLSENIRSINAHSVWWWWWWWHKNSLLQNESYQSWQWVTFCDPWPIWPIGLVTHDPLTHDPLTHLSSTKNYKISVQVFEVLLTLILPHLEGLWVLQCKLHVLAHSLPRLT